MEKNKENGWVQLKDLKNGDFFKKKPEAKKVWSRGCYDRAYKVFNTTDCNDVWGSGSTMRGSALVFINFEF